MCLIGLVFIGLVVLMILSASGYGGNLNTPTYVKDSIKSSSTNSTSKGWFYNYIINILMISFSYYDDKLKRCAKEIEVSFF